MNASPAVYVDRSRRPVTLHVYLPGDLRDSEAGLKALGYRIYDMPGLRWYRVDRPRTGRGLAQQLARFFGGCWYAVYQSAGDAKFCTGSCASARCDTVDECTCLCEGLFHCAGFGTSVGAGDLVLVEHATRVELRQWVKAA